jgi:GTP cyclohydrolase I
VAKALVLTNGYRADLHRVINQALFLDTDGMVIAGHQLQSLRHHMLPFHGAATSATSDGWCSGVPAARLVAARRLQLRSGSPSRRAGGDGGGRRQGRERDDPGATCA